MRYSEMTPDQIEKLLDRSENYPLRVSFLGKTGLLGESAIRLLREHDVDFEIDDHQAFEVLGAEVALTRPSGCSGLLLGVFSSLLASFLLFRRLFGGRRAPPG